MSDENSEVSSDVRRPALYDEMFPGRFLRAGLFDGKTRTLTITDVVIEELPTDKGEMQTKGILHFEQTNMQLSLNKTNGTCLKAMFGNQVKNWVGKRVTFCSEKDKFGKDTVDAIRIKGSPDIDQDIDVEIRMPKKKPKMRRLTKTVRAAKPDTTTTEQPVSDTNGAV